MRYELTSAASLAEQAKAPHLLSLRAIWSVIGLKTAPPPQKKFYVSGAGRICMKSSKLFVYFFIWGEQKPAVDVMLGMFALCEGGSGPG